MTRNVDYQDLVPAHYIRRTPTRKGAHTGSIGVVGVFVPEDPGAADELAKKGQLAFDFGKFFSKGQTIGTGQANVKAYNRQLRDLIHQDNAKPSMLVSHNLGLGDAPDAYRRFDAREKGWTKIVLNPANG